MKKMMLTGVVLALAGCGSFNLGYVHSQAGKTAEQQQIDTLVCKDQAQTAANTADRQIGSFLAGLTVVGAPIAMEAEKSKQREVFASCMQARGYTVSPPERDLADAPQTPFGTHRIRLALPAGFESQPVAEAWQKNGVFFYALNKSTDTATFLSAAPRNAIKDMPAYVASLKARQESALTDPQSSSITKVTVNEHHALRYEVTGVTNGIKVTYMTTVIEGAQQICVVNSWTSATNFQSQRETISAIPQRVSGVI